MIATGTSLSSAADLAGEIETLAHQYLAAITVAEPEILSRAEMDIVIEKFKTYGAEAQK